MVSLHREAIPLPFQEYLFHPSNCYQPFPISLRNLLHHVPTLTSSISLSNYSFPSPLLGLSHFLSFSLGKNHLKALIDPFLDWLIDSFIHSLNVLGNTAGDTFRYNPDFMELTEKYFLKWLFRIVLSTRKKNKMLYMYLHIKGRVWGAGDLTK